MSKIKEYVRHLAVVAMATLLAQCAWADKVISIDLQSAKVSGGDMSGETAYGLVAVPGSAWTNDGCSYANNSANKNEDLSVTVKEYDTTAGTTTDLSSDVVLHMNVNNAYYWTNATDPFLKAYADDSRQPIISVKNVPYSKYTVIVYCATDSENKQFGPVTVNGTPYKYDAETRAAVVASGSTSTEATRWGASRSLTAVEGTNAIRITGQAGKTLTVMGGTNANGARGGLAGLQIIEEAAVVENIDGGSAYSTASLPAEADVINLTMNDGGVITIAAAMTKNVNVICTGSVKFVSDEGYAYTTADLAKFDVSGVTGSAIRVIDTAAIPEGLAAPTTGWTYRYEGTTALAALPFNTTASFSGTVEVAAPVTVKDGDSWAALPVHNNKNYVFAEGAVIEANSFQTGNGSGSVENFVQNGGSLTVNSDDIGNTTSAAFLLAHWGSTIGYTLNDGSISVPNGGIRLGWDGNGTLTQNGGTVTAKGLRANRDGHNGRGIYNLNGGTLTLGANGIDFGSTGSLVLGGGKIIASETATMTLDAGLAIPVETTIEVAEGKTLTINAVLSGTADLVKTGAGTLIISQVPNEYTGAIKINEGALDVQGNRDLQNIQFAEGTTIIITESISDDGTIYVTGITGTPAIKIQTANGEEISEQTGAVITTGEGWVKAIFTPSVTGKVAMFDFPFNGDLSSVGWDMRTLSYDQGPYYNDDNTAVLAYTRPWNGIQLNAPFSVAVYGTVPSKANTCLISFGSSANNIFLASGPNPNEVVLISVVGGAATELTKMTVPSASTIKHLYAFTLSADKKVVDIYLDGVPNIQYTSATALSIGAGIQVSGWYGGTVGGYSRCDNASDGGMIDELLVYNAPLKANAMSRLSTLFPYASEKGLYQRTMSESGTWTSEGAWTKHGAEGTFDAPVDGAMAEVSVSAAETITLSLDSGSNIETESLKIAGSAIKIVKGEGSGILKNLGATTIQAPLSVGYDAVELLGPLSISGEGSIDFDFSAYPISSVLEAKTIQVTGLAKGLEGKVTATLPAELAGRTMTFGLDAANTYVMTIGFTREAGELYTATGDVTIMDNTVYTDSEGNETLRFYDDDWIVVNHEQTVTIGENLTHPAKIKVVEGGVLTLNFGSDVTISDFKYNATVRVEEGGVYDIANANGHKDYSHPIVLAGGTLTNTGIATTVDARQYWQNTVAADSTIDVSGNEFGAVKSGHAAHDYNLGGNVLTKTGAGQYTFKTANFVGGGTLAVEEGTFILDSCTVPEGATLNFVVASEATIIVKGNNPLAKTGTVTGSGTVIYENGVDTSAIYQDTGWTGTLWIKGMNWNDWDLGREGTAGSSLVKLTGFTGYAPNSTTAGCNATVELADNGNTKAVSVNNGYSTGAFFFKKIIGSGTFTATSANTSKHIYKFHDVSEFTGKLEANNIRIVVGTGNVGDDAGTMAFTDGIVINGGLNWSATKVTFGDTLKVKGSVGDAIVTATTLPETMPAVTLIDAEGQPVEGEYTLEADGTTLKVVKAGPEPIDPTQPKTYDTEAEATAAAEAINANKTELIAKPFETMTDAQKAVYDALVTAKVVGNAVVVDFSETGATTARDSADNALEAADILGAEKTAATVDAIPGLYYAIIGGTDVSAITTSGAAVQAVDTKVTLEKPNLGTTSAGFYRVKVSVTALTAAE